MATETKRTFETRIDIAEGSREELVQLLNARLADTFDLYSQLKQAHWNVKGSDFIQLHELYDDVAEGVLEYVDAVEGMDTVAAIADRLATYGASVRAGIDAAVEFDDQATADLFTEVSRAIDKHLWFVEAHLQS